MAVAAEQAAVQLRRSILKGELAPGSRLGEVELAAQLGMSRTPIREALRSLSAQGLVEILPNRGARVVQWSAADLQETYELRSMLESHAARRAAPRISTDAITLLDSLCDDMDACAHRGDGVELAQLTDLNTRFHRTILEAADSPRLTSMLESLVQVSLMVRTFAKYSPEALLRSMSHHRELTVAMRVRSPEWAAAVMQTHVLAASSVLLDAATADRTGADQ